MNDEMKTGVYEIVHLASGKRYVGSTSKSFSERWRKHVLKLSKSSHHSRYLQNAWEKYGPDAFEFRIVEVTKPEHAVAVEQTFIDWRKSAQRKHGYNISPTASSQLGLKLSDEARAAISRRSKEQFGTTEARIAVSKRMKAYFGTQEARDKQSIASKKFHSAKPEIALAQSARAKAFHGTPEARQKQSARAKAYFEANPLARSAASEKSKSQFGTPEAREAASQRTKSYNADPVLKAARIAKCRATRNTNKLAMELSGETRKLSEKEKARYSNCERRPRQSETMKLLFSDPVRKAEYFAKRRATITANKLSKASG